MPNPLLNLRSRLTGGRLHLAIATHGIALTRSSSAWSKNKQAIAEIACTQDQLQPACLSLLAHPSCRGLPLMITLGHGWGRLFMVTPPPRVEQHSVLVAAAGMRFQSLFGKNKTEWHIEADWQIDRPFLACAYPKSLLTTLRDIAQQHSTPLLSITPYFVAEWNNWCEKLPSNAWFGVMHDEVLILGMTSAAQPLELVGVRSIPIPEHGHSSAWIEEQLHRTALQNDLAIPQQVHVLGNRAHYWQQKNIDATEQRVVNLPDNTSYANTASSAIQMLDGGDVS